MVVEHRTELGQDFYLAGLSYRLDGSSILEEEDISGTRLMSAPLHVFRSRLALGKHQMDVRATLWGRSSALERYEFQADAHFSFAVVAGETTTILVVAEDQGDAAPDPRARARLRYQVSHREDGTSSAARVPSSGIAAETAQRGDVQPEGEPGGEATVILVHHNELPSSLVLKSAAYEFDGRKLAARDAAHGDLQTSDPWELFNGRVDSGGHDIQVKLFIEGAQMSMSSGYSFEVDGTYHFKAVAGTTTWVKIIAFEGGHFWDDLKDRVKIRYELVAGTHRP